MKKTTANKNITSTVWRLAIGLAVSAVLSANAAGVKPVKADLVHFISQADMVNTGVEPNASGKINVTLNDQGNADKQQLKIAVSKLNPNTSYELFAFIGDDTNATDIAGFTTDKKGAFTIAYMKKSQGKANPKGPVLPVALDPMCNVREMDIVNGNTNAVLTAVLSNPDKGQYRVKGYMHPVGFIPAATGSFQISANAKVTRFQLKASGLTPNTDYSLAFNGVLAQTYTSDKKGRLTVNSLPTNAPSVLEIQTVALTAVSYTHLTLPTIYSV